MGFALCPDEGPPRLWRFVDETTRGDSWPDDMVSVLHPGNILVINRPLFEQLPELQRHMLLRTHERYEYV